MPSLRYRFGYTHFVQAEALLCLQSVRNSAFLPRKTGIERLHELVESGKLISGKETSTSLTVTLYNRLQQLKTQREGLEIKQGFNFIFPRF